MPQPSPEHRYPDRRFSELQERLLRAGIAPRHVRRYLAELSDHLADLTAEQHHSGLSPAAARSAALLRLGSTDTLAAALLAQPGLRSLSARAPWAIFSLAPFLLLASLWFLSLCLLRLGWHIFLPEAVTPFGSPPGPHTFLEPRNIYFQLNRTLYLAAPILAGWGMLLIAARQRLSALWPILSLTLLGLLAATARVDANRNAVPAGFGHIRLTLALRPAVQNEYALVVFLCASLPYLLWRFTTHRSTSS